MPRHIYLPYLEHEASRALGLGTPENPFTSALEFMGMLNHVGTHVDALSTPTRTVTRLTRCRSSCSLGKAVALDLRHIPGSQHE